MTVKKKFIRILFVTIIFHVTAEDQQTFSTGSNYVSGVGDCKTFFQT